MPSLMLSAERERSSRVFGTSRDVSRRRGKLRCDEPGLGTKSTLHTPFPSGMVGGCRGNIYKWVPLFSWSLGWCDTVDGSEIRPSPVEVGSLSRYLQSFMRSRWCRIPSINSSSPDALIFSDLQLILLFFLSKAFEKATISSDRPFDAGLSEMIYQLKMAVARNYWHRNWMWLKYTGKPCGPRFSS